MQTLRPVLHHLASRPAAMRCFPFLFLVLLSLILSAQDDLSPLPELPPLSEEAPGELPELPALPQTLEVPPLLEPNFSQKTPSSVPTATSLGQGKDELIRPPANLDLKGKDLKFSRRSDGTLTWTVTQDVRLRGDNGLEIYADRALVDGSQAVVTLTGEVSVYQDGVLSRWKKAFYYYNKKRFEAQGVRTGLDPILLESEKFQVITHKGKQLYLADGGGLTTHDVERPDFWVRSDRTTVIPGDRVIFKNLKLFYQDRQVFWLPFLSQPLDQNLGYHIEPGARSNLGFFLKNRYGVMLGGVEDPLTGEKEGAWLRAQYLADLYSRRGLGLGYELFDTRVPEDAAYGWLKLYHLYDFSPSVERSGVERENEDPNRYRIDLAHRLPLWNSLTAQYTLDANLTLLSDLFFLEDFDQDTFLRDPQPDNTISFTRRSATSLTALGARVRLNDFYQSDTRLPELTFDWLRQPLGSSRWIYENQFSLGIIDEKEARLSDEDRRLLEIRTDPEGVGLTRGIFQERGFWRFHTYHELSRPFRMDFLQLVPRVGAGYLRYGDVQGEGVNGGRALLSAGMDASFKLTRLMPDWVNQKWGLQGALHTLQPYANFSFLEIDDLGGRPLAIDALPPSVRPRPLRPGRFTALDDLNDWSILRLGLRNRIATHRNDGSHDWLTMDTYLDLFFDDPEFERKSSNLYNDLTFHPLPWLNLALETQFPLFNKSNFTELALRADYMPNPDLDFSLSFRHLENHPVLRDSQRLSFKTFYRANEDWGFSARQRWEFADSTLELQEYTAHRDLGALVGSVGVFHRDNRRQDEYGILFSIGLKDLPALNLPLKFGAE